MAIPVIPIQAETPAQANPFATSWGMLNDAIKGAIINQYLPQSLSADVMGKNLQNQMAYPEAQMAPQFAQAKLAAAQAGIPLTQAQTQEILQGRIPLNQAMTGMYGTEAQTAQQLMPYKVQEQQGKVFQDPLMQKLFEYSLAHKTGEIPSQYIQAAGVPTPEQISGQATQNMPNLGNFISGAIQNKGLNPISNNFQQGVNPLNSPNGYTGNSFQNWALFGSPLNPIQMAQMKSGAETQGKTGVTNWNDELSKAQAASDDSNQLLYTLNQFQNAYKNATYKGPTLGTLPTSGWKTAFLGDLSPEQQVDKASKALSNNIKDIIGGRVTQYEFANLKDMNPSRTDTPETAQVRSDYLIQRAQQMQELPKFMIAAKNEGLDLRTSQNLWNMYRQQRPVYNFQTKTPYPQFIDSWREYLNPEAVQAVQNGQPYLSVPKFSNKADLINWYHTLPEADKNTFRNEYSGAISK